MSKSTWYKESWIQHVVKIVFLVLHKKNCWLKLYVTHHDISTKLCFWMLFKDNQCTNHLVSGVHSYGKNESMVLSWIRIVNLSVEPLLPFNKEQKVEVLELVTGSASEGEQANGEFSNGWWPQINLDKLVLQKGCLTSCWWLPCPWFEWLTSSGWLRRPEK